jgi:hypothetical protein
MKRLAPLQTLLSCALLALVPAACGRITASDPLLGGAPGDASSQVGDGDGGTTSGGDGGGPSDASPSPTDAVPPSLGPDAAFMCGGSVDNSTLVHLETFPNAPWDGGYEFFRRSDVVAFFQNLAVANGFDDAARGVHCAKGSDPTACGYDPMLPRTTAAEIAYVDALNRFTGPDGEDWILKYVLDRNIWLIADRRTSPDTYAIILAINQCPFP